ncbi:MAG: hypothetical protein AAF564_23330 [Bacteroidota bacterium]
MDHKTTIERILAIEKAMDVAAIRYKGVHLWPFVRMQLWQRLLHPNKYAPPAAIGLRRLAHKLSQGFFRPDFYAPYLEHAKRHRSNLAELTDFGSVDVLFFSRQEEHEDVFGGRYYNRLVDPFIDLVKTQYTFLKLELITDQTQETLPRFEHTYFFDSLDYLRCDAQRSVIAAFQESPTIERIQQGNVLTQLLAGTRFDLALTEEYLMMEGERLLHYIRYFKEALAAIRPKVVMLSNYYDNLGMALVSAAKSMGIVTVDIQKDVQGQYHGMYSCWDKAPDAGYEMIPDICWCWGKPAVEHMRLGAGTFNPRPLIGGNLWLEKWQDQEPVGFGLEPEATTFLDGLRAPQKVVLVSLQQSDRAIPDAMLEAMRKAPPDWFWLIRLHPAQRNKISALQEALEALHLENVNVEEASQLPLYPLLKQSHRHVTQWSTIAVEALRFNVPSLIIHPTGRAQFNHYIKQGHFSYATHAEGIIDALTAPRPPLVEETPYIETNRMFAREALEEIMRAYKVPAPVTEEMLAA